MTEAQIKSRALQLSFLLIVKDFELAKKCAIIAVDEILNLTPSLPILGYGGTFGEDIELSTAFLKEVRVEIEKL